MGLGVVTIYTKFAYNLYNSYTIVQQNIIFVSKLFYG